MPTYDPQKVILTYGPVGIVTGFADGTFIEAERTTDSFKPVVGADGEGAWLASADRSATLKCSLLQTSLSNDALSASLALDELTKLGGGPLMLKDAGGGTLISFPYARLIKPAAVKDGKEIDAREWTFATTRADVFEVGGNV
jgi:hypothetical protein